MRVVDDLPLRDESGGHLGKTLKQHDRQRKVPAGKHATLSPTSREIDVYDIVLAKVGGANHDMALVFQCSQDVWPWRCQAGCTRRRHRTARWARRRRRRRSASRGPGRGSPLRVSCQRAYAPLLIPGPDPRRSQLRARARTPPIPLRQRCRHGSLRSLRHVDVTPNDSRSPAAAHCARRPSGAARCQAAGNRQWSHVSLHENRPAFGLVAITAPTGQRPRRPRPPRHPRRPRCSGATHVHSSEATRVGLPRWLPQAPLHTPLPLAAWP